jgi:hypothetical protein
MGSLTDKSRAQYTAAGLNNRSNRGLSLALKLRGGYECQSRLLESVLLAFSAIKPCVPSQTRLIFTPRSQFGRHFQRAHSSTGGAADAFVWAALPCAARAAADYQQRRIYRTATLSPMRRVHLNYATCPYFYPATISDAAGKLKGMLAIMIYHRSHQVAVNRRWCGGRARTGWCEIQ